MKPIVICILLCLMLFVGGSVYILINHEQNKRAKRFDIRWLALMKKVVNQIEICHQLKMISETEYEQFMKEIDEQVEVYEKWVSRTIGQALEEL